MFGALEGETLGSGCPPLPLSAGQYKTYNDHLLKEDPKVSCPLCHSRHWPPGRLDGPVLPGRVPMAQGLTVHGGTVPPRAV